MCSYPMYSKQHAMREESRVPLRRRNLTWLLPGMAFLGNTCPSIGVVRRLKYVHLSTLCRGDSVFLWPDTREGHAMTYWARRSASVGRRAPPGNPTPLQPQPQTSSA